MTDNSLRCWVPYPAVLVANATDGPLRGLTLGVKDLYDVKGYPTGCGSPHMLAMSGTKKAHAPLVTLMLKAGAQFAGKTVTDELAFSLNGKNAHFGSPVNAAAPDRITGGSSSGSASAVSGRLVDVALGTDTGGSVRAPASYCGLFGIRPTHGRVSLKGCWPLADSFDTPGYFTRDGATFVRVGEVFLGKDKSPLPETPRLMIAEDMIGQAVPAAEIILRDVIRRLSLTMGEITGTTLAKDIDALYWAFRWLQGREAWAADGAMIETYNPPLGPGVAERFAFARTITDEQVEAGNRTRTAYRAKVKKLLGKDGVILMPTVPDIAPLTSTSEADLDDFRNRALRLLCPSGLTGFPQISIPVAMRDGAPLGLSILGPPGSDLSLVRLAAKIEAAARIRIA
ncbi:MAG: amidase [Hyphomicrobiales bacterium]|nr:amidase [Hyphomicrobiales bacterium]